MIVQLIQSQQFMFSLTPSGMSQLKQNNMWIGMSQIGIFNYLKDIFFKGGDYITIINMMFFQDEKQKGKI